MYSYFTKVQTKLNYWSLDPIRGAKGRRRRGKKPIGLGQGGVTPNVLGVLPPLYEARRTTAKIGNEGSLRKELHFSSREQRKNLQIFSHKRVMIHIFSHKTVMIPVEMDTARTS